MEEHYEEVARSCACKHLREASRAVTQLYDQALRPSGLRITQFTILVGIRLSEPVALTDLAERLVIDRTTLSRNLRLLEEHELATSESGDDARIRKVVTTERGRRMLEEAHPLWQSAQTRVEEVLGAAGLGRLLGTLRETVDIARGVA